MHTLAFLVMLGGAAADVTASHVRFSPCDYIADRGSSAIYADMHDGDRKEVTISGNSLTIKPSGNSQTWVVTAALDRKSCSANVDFNVPGKPSPPPVNLTATLWASFGDGGDVYPKETLNYEFEFTDPSGKLGVNPLNHWVELKKEPWELNRTGCPPPFRKIFADMHDGDMKEVTMSETSITIKPSGNNQTWVVTADLDVHFCSAMIDFNVPGKPNPPPVNLKASLLNSFPASPQSQSKFEFEFTDPTGHLASKEIPLNLWVELPYFGRDIVV